MKTISAGIHGVQASVWVSETRMLSCPSIQSQLCLSSRPCCVCQSVYVHVESKPRLSRNHWVTLVRYSSWILTSQKLHRVTSGPWVVRTVRAYSACWKLIATLNNCSRVSKREIIICYHWNCSHFPPIHTAQTKNVRISPKDKACWSFPIEKSRRCSR